MPFAISSRTVEETTTISLSGELDAFTAPQLSAAVDTIAFGPRSALIIDMLEVTFVDSSALNSLLTLHRLMFGDRRLILVTPTVVRRLLSHTKLDLLFEQVDDLAAARTRAAQ